MRKLNVGMASVLLGVTIFGINFTNHSVKAATTESVEKSKQPSTAVLPTAEQTKGINAIGAVKVPSLTDSQNDANKAIDDALNKKNSEINGATTIDQTTKDKLNQAATDAADKAKEAITKATTNNDVATEQTDTQKAASATGKVQQSSASNNAIANNSTEAATTSSTKAKQTTQTATKNSDNTKVSSNTTNKENSQPTDKTTNTQVASNIDKTLASLLTKLLAIASTTDDSASGSSTLQKSDQTVTKVTDPMMEDYKNRGGKNTWIDKTVARGAYDYPSLAENAIFGDKGILKQKQNSDKYFFAGYADFSEHYHRIILFARGQDAGDKKLYTYVVHTHSDKVQQQTETPNETAPEIEYKGWGNIWGGSTHNLQVHNYNGESFSVVLKGFKGGYGLTPIFDQGILNPKYKSKTEKQLDDTSGINYKEQIGRWASVIPQETTTSVRYVDLETGKDIAQPLMVTGYGYQGFKINGNAPKIDGYTLVSSPKTLDLSYEDGIIAPYKVGKTYTQYFTDDVYVKQTVIDTNGTVRATAYYKGQPLGASASKILGHDDNNDSMSFMAGGQSYTYNNRINNVDAAMVYYYQKVGEEGKSQLRVHYIDVTKDTDDSQYAPGDGVPATDPISGQKMDPKIYTGNIGKTTYDYATNAKIPEGYVLVGTSPNIKGTFSKSDHDAYIYVKIDRNGAKTTIKNLTHLNNAQKQAAEAAIDQATDLNTITQAKQDASTLDRAMGTLKQAITDGEATHGTVAYDEADPGKKSTLDNAIKNGQAVTDATNGSNADLTTVKDLSQAIENAQTGLNGDSNLATAKEQADQNIDDVAKAAKQAIDNTKGLTDSEKQAAKSQVDTDAKAAKGAIDKADSNDAVTNAFNNGTVAINKDAANAAIDGALAEKNNLIDATNLTAEEKKAVKEQAKKAADSAKTDISKASTVTDVESAKNTGVDTINKVKVPDTSATKDDANKAIDDALAKKIEEINKSNLTDEEKAKLTTDANAAANNAKANIQAAKTNDAVNTAKNNGIAAINGIPVKSNSVDDQDNSAINEGNGNQAGHIQSDNSSDATKHSSTQQSGNVIDADKDTIPSKDLIIGVKGEGISGNNAEGMNGNTAKSGSKNNSLKTLPQTRTKDVTILEILGLFLSLFGLLGLKKKHREE